MFRPIAASALTIRNLLTLFVPETNSAGSATILATTDMATKPRINQGNIFLMLKLAFSSSGFLLFFRASCFFRRREINANVITVGMMESVLVNLTIVAKSPAPSENAYPVATTDEVSLTAVPAQIPKASSLIPIALPIIGKRIIIAISKRNVADIA